MEVVSDVVVQDVAATHNLQGIVSTMIHAFVLDILSPLGGAMMSSFPPVTMRFSRRIACKELFPWLDDFGLVVVPIIIICRAGY